MPAVPGATTYHRPLGDRFGDVVHGRHLAFAGLGLATGVGVGLLAGGGPLRRVAAGLGASLVAPTLVALGSAALLHAERPDGHAATVPGAGTDAGRSAKAESLRVMTFNIREGIGPMGQEGGTQAQVDAIADEIAAQHPDVVVLQEVTDGSLQSRLDDVPAMLARRLHPTSMVFGGSMTQLVGNRKGQAVLTFGGARVTAARALHHPEAGGSGLLRQLAGTFGPLVRPGSTSDLLAPYNARSTTDAIVRTAGGRDVRVLTAHWVGGGLPSEGAGGEAAAQRRQLDPVAATNGVGTAAGMPTILAGDFNQDTAGALGDRERAVLGTAGMRDAFLAVGVGPTARERASFPVWGLRSAIDHVYVSDRVAVRSVRVAADGAPSSDHRPVVADLVIA